MKAFLALVTLLSAGSAIAESISAVRTIRPGEIVGPGDIQLVSTAVPGTAQSIDQVVGLEAKVAIYAGRPVFMSDLGPPAVVERNEIIQLIYKNGSLMITTDGRALDRAAIGDRVRVMNIESRTIVIARVFEDGAAYVSN